MHGTLAKRADPLSLKWSCQVQKESVKLVNVRLSRPQALALNAQTSKFCTVKLVPCCPASRVASILDKSCFFFSHLFRKDRSHSARRLVPCPVNERTKRTNFRPGRKFRSDWDLTFLTFISPLKTLPCNCLNEDTSNAKYVCFLFNQLQ